VSVFVDTSALYALLDRDDRFHASAAAVFTDLLTRQEPLHTSNYVVVESIALVQRPHGTPAVSGRVEILQPTHEMQWVTEEDHRMGIAAVLAANRRELSLVDCVSFRMMRRLRIRRSFAFDPHFAEQGFESPRPGRADP
jgi:predicted nucleic acid-binding protein